MRQVIDFRYGAAALSAIRPNRVALRYAMLGVLIVLASASAVVVVAAAGEQPDTAPAGKDSSAQVDPQKQELFRKTVTAARTAMSRRDPAGGKRNARAASKLAQTPEEDAEAARLDALAQYLEEFWKTMGKVIGGLLPAQEFNVGTTPLIVVETSPTQITFRSEGRNRSYAVKDLPLPIIEALVQGGFADNADTKLIFGAYLAMDARGDRQAARKLWQELINAGKDVSELMPELNLAPVAKAPESMPAKPDKPDKPEAAAGEVPADPAALRKAEQAVYEQFAVDRNLASSVPGKIKLAEKLVSAASAANVPAALRYVMLRDARDYALSAGKSAAACEIIDRMAEHFSVDALELKTAALEQTAKTARTTAGNKEAAECALKLADEAVQAQQWDQAIRLAAIAVATAQRARNVALVRTARETKQNVDEAADKAGAGGTKRQ